MEAILAIGLAVLVGVITYYLGKEKGYGIGNNTSLLIGRETLYEKTKRANITRQNNINDKKSYLATNKNDKKVQEELKKEQIIFDYNKQLEEWFKEDFDNTFNTMKNNYPECLVDYYNKRKTYTELN